MKDEEIRELVLAELRSEKVKLWLPPFVEENSSRANRTEINHLAERLATKIPKYTKEPVYAALMSLQEHSLAKLAAKTSSSKKPVAANATHSVEIKLLGLKNDSPSAELENISVDSWATRVNLDGRVLRLDCVNPDLNAVSFMEGLRLMLKASSVRLVHRGKSIPSTKDRLVSFIRSSAKETPTANVLCLVSYDETSRVAEDGDRALAGRIRDGASRLPLDRMLDLTDQHGANVSMRPSDKVAFVSALGLHRLGRQRMDQEENIASALFLLLEADHDWSGVSSHWRSKVDNYGLLQIDIAWVYFKLQSMTHLPDAMKRLEIAEAMLRQQVHMNFVTLAVTQAEMGNPVPPLAAIFCRLFLLQGIAYSYSPEHQSRSQERLDWAHLLCRSLRDVSPGPKVEVLCEATGVSQCLAIAALRKVNGNADRAIDLLEESSTNDERQRERRERQRKLGRCKNSTDYVNLDLIPALQGILGFSQVSQVPLGTLQTMDLGYTVSAGLLRLADNNLQSAIDIFQETHQNSDAVLQRISNLDRQFEDQNVVSGRARKRTRNAEESGLMEVDEVALATLLSMGVDRAHASEALLQSENNTERSLLWLANRGDEHVGTVHQRSGQVGEDAAGRQGEVEAAAHKPGDEAKVGAVDIRQDEERIQAEQFLRQELKEVLQDSNNDKDYLGSTLDEEWAFLSSFASR